MIRIPVSTKPSGHGTVDMINQMNKHMNHLSLPWSAVQALEKSEHGLKKAPSKEQALALEAEEHGKKMTMSQLLKVESKEHVKPEDDEEEDDDEEDDDMPDQSASAPYHNSLGAMIIKSGGKRAK